MVVVKCWQILERPIVRLFARLLSNERSEKQEIPPAACSTPKALYVSMSLAALEEMVGNEQNVRHGRIDSELEKHHFRISLGKYLPTIGIRYSAPSNNFHWQWVDDVREMAKLVPDSVRLGMPLARLDNLTTFQPVSTLLLLLFCFINLLEPEL